MDTNSFQVYPLGGTNCQEGRLRSDGWGVGTSCPTSSLGLGRYFSMTDDHPTSSDAMPQEVAASGAGNRLCQVILPTCARDDDLRLHSSDSARKTHLGKTLRLMEVRSGARQGVIA